MAFPVSSIYFFTYLNSSVLAVLNSGYLKNSFGVYVEVKKSFPMVCGTRKSPPVSSRKGVSGRASADVSTLSSCVSAGDAI